MKRLTALTLVLATASLFAQKTTFATQQTALDAAYGKKDWNTYLALATRLGEASPHNGLFWYQRGIGLAGLNRNEEALAAFQKALDRGTNVQRTHVRMAGLEAKLGHNEAAVTHFVAARKAHLENAEQVLMGNPDLMALLPDPKAGPALFPKLPDNASREAKWKADLAFFRTRFLETHYPFFEQVDRAAWEGRLDALEAEVPKLEDWQVTMRLNQIARMTKAGHTLVVPPFLGSDTFHLAPVILHKFSDGWYVRGAAQEHKDLVGRRVLKVGNRTPEEALTLLEPLVPHDNASGLQWSAGTFMAIPEYLVFLGVLPSRDALVLTIEEGGSARTVTIPAKPLNPQSMQAFGQVRHLPPGYASARRENKPTPLWLKEPERAFWFEELPAQKAMYVQLNRVQDDGKESLADFTRRLFATIEAQKVERLILDLRHNNGGNGELRWPLLHAIGAHPSINKTGNLYVITGPRTFSAAANLVGDLDRQTYPIFVGESAGAGPNFVGEDNAIMLPNHNLIVIASSHSWQSAYSNDARTEVMPELEAIMSSEDYREGRDPAMALILAQWPK